MKFYYFAVILVGIMIMLGAAGVKTNSVTLATSLNVINATGGNLENFKNSELWSKDTAPTSSSPGVGLKWLFVGFVIASLVITAFGRSPDTKIVLAIMVWALGGLIIADLISLYMLLAAEGIIWIKWVAVSIF